ncbi:MAG: CBS domain-containing protein [Chloroflexi bacterium]|nr:CBS domain-containing protein [Chloroflexota bacterium]
MLVKDRMTPNPMTITPETTHKQATELIREHKLHHLPVVDKQGRLVGIIIEEDLLAAQPSPATTLSIYEIHGLLSKLEIKQIMSHPVFTTTKDCPLEEAARLMLREGIGCLPVMEEGKVIGIITDTDIFDSLVALLGEGEEGARFTLLVPDKPGILARLSQAVADAGGNIISATCWRSKDDGKTYITIKEQGAKFEALKQTLMLIEDTKLVHILDKPLGSEKCYG